MAVSLLFPKRPSRRMATDSDGYHNSLVVTYFRTPPTRRVQRLVHIFALRRSEPIASIACSGSTTGKPEVIRLKEEKLACVPSLRVTEKEDGYSDLTATFLGSRNGNRMVTSSEFDRTFGALADSTRRGILRRLSHGDATVGELARPFRVSRPAISKHLRVLEKAKLVRRTREGRISRCRLDAAPMRAAAAWVEQYRIFWEGQLDQLARYMEGQET